jgi:thiamine biosynthesis protein ThiS
VQIYANDAPHDLAEGTTVAQLLALLELADKPVAVELNRRVVPKARHGEQVLAAGDRLEIVTLVGGG